MKKNGEAARVESGFGPKTGKRNKMRRLSHLLCAHDSVRLTTRVEVRGGGEQRVAQGCVAAGLDGKRMKERQPERKGWCVCVEKRVRGRELLDGLRPSGTYGGGRWCGGQGSCAALRDGGCEWTEE